MISIEIAAMAEFSEKRDFHRMTLENAFEYRLLDKDQLHQGVIKNLSATGVLFVTNHSIPPATKLRIKISPQNQITPPMQADITVVRCNSHSDDEYYLAGEIVNML